MAKVWRIMPNHHVARINPSLATGTAVSGYPAGNFRTLDPNKRGRVTTDGSGNALIAWDRGAPGAGGSLRALDCLFMAGSFVSVSPGLLLEDDDNSNFFSPAVLLNDATWDFGTENRDPTLRLFDSDATSQQRYLAFGIIGGSATTTYEIGLVSVGKQYLLGQELLGGVLGGTAPQNVIPTETGELVMGRPKSGLRQRQWRFIQVPTATARTIFADWSQRYIYSSANSDVDGWGGASGAMPIVMAEFDSADTSSDQISNGDVYYGPARMVLNERTAYHSTIDIQMDAPWYIKEL